MQHDEDGGRKIGRQTLYQFHQGRQTTGRGSDDNNISLSTERFQFFHKEINKKDGTIQITHQHISSPSAAPAGKKGYFVHNIKTLELSEGFLEAFGDVDLSKEVEANIADIVAEQFAGGCEHEILVSEESNTELIMADLVNRFNVKLRVLGKRISDKSTDDLSTKLLRVLPCSVLVFLESDRPGSNLEGTGDSS